MGMGRVRVAISVRVVVWLRSVRCWGQCKLRVVMVMVSLGLS